VKASAKIPSATYRLQFNRGFTFEHAADILDYLRDLGISDLYASPVLKAGPSSTHGYDVCSFEEVNPNLGGESALDALTAKLREHDMGLLLDLVPNHMGADCTNSWLTDVLAKGEHSQFSSWFDIDWNSPVPRLKGKVLLPTLEDIQGKVLEAGKLCLAYEENQFRVKYYDRAFPLRDETEKQLQAETGAEGLEQVLAAYNGRSGDARSFDALDRLLEQQHYRLAWWRLAGQIINYRRFFDVSELIALRMELPEVFSATHRLALRWCKEGKVTGLRIDHPDGLFDPRQYFERLQRAAADSGGDNPNSQSLYIVAEKILSRDERLPLDWPVAGTTGYDFLNQVNGLFVDGANEQPFSNLYRDFTGCAGTFEDAAYAGKKQVLFASFLGELNGLSRHLLEIATAARSGRDLTLHILKSALAEIIACFPVYRTYATGETGQLSATEQRQVTLALENARRHAAPLLLPAMDWIGAILLLQTPNDLNAELKTRCRDFVLKFQQLTGPVTAKGIEDTAFYNYNRLVSLNEVGGDPGRFGISVDAFHQYNEVTARSWPHSLLASATHDTKRGEDVRARLNILSEMPEQWSAAIQQWSKLNEQHKTKVAGRLEPEGNDEYLLYQTLVGAWPDESDAEAGENPDPVSKSRSGLNELAERVSAYLLKATREAKRNTSWTDPNADYEHATKLFIERLLDAALSKSFHQTFLRFQRTVGFFGRINSLSQTLVKLTSPGVPDIYQGTELWDLSLVDPDNRRPVDFARRRAALEKVRGWQSAAPITEITAETKLFLIWRTLQFRNEHRAVFDHGDYFPLSVEGSKRDHLCAFARTTKDKLTSITVVPRLVFRLLKGELRLPLGDLWSNTLLRLPSGVSDTEFTNLFTGETIRASANATISARTLFASFPVALLAA
jgi:(1->4)-alpha-D-glucan 1-alpha-D-glucosylmutase